MFESSEFRHQLAADRRAALRRSGEHGPPSSLRRARRLRTVRRRAVGCATTALPNRRQMRQRP